VAASTSLPRAQGRALVAGLWVFGAYSIALGALMVVAPGTFFDRIGPFGTYNAHYVLDVATWYLAFGTGLLLAVRRSGWRTPLLAFGVLQNIAHLINHVVDIDEADPTWIGVFDVVALVLVTGVLTWLLAGALRADGVR
jgi:hypothetical protein